MHVQTHKIMVMAYLEQPECRDHGGCRAICAVIGGALAAGELLQYSD